MRSVRYWHCGFTGIDPAPWTLHFVIGAALYPRLLCVAAKFRLYLQPLVAAVGFSCRSHRGSRGSPLVVTPSARFRVRLGSVLSIAGVPPNSPDMGLKCERTLF